MFQRIVLIGAAFFFLLSGAARAGDEEILSKIGEAYGDLEALQNAEAYGFLGVLKWYGSGMMKFDYRIQARFPDRVRTTLEGMAGTYHSQGQLVAGTRGWSFQKEACRPLAPDEIEGALQSLADARLLAELVAGKRKWERVEDQTFDGIDCASLRLLGEEDRDITLHFDKSTWLLYRQDESTRGREGGRSAEYTVFEDYDEFNGIKVALTRQTYILHHLKNLMQDRYDLVQKVLVDEVTFEPEIEASTFQPPEDIFDVAGVGSDASEERIQALLACFQGRRDPNKAGWACRALAALDATDAVAQLATSTDKEVLHYAHLARIRMGTTEGLPDKYSVSYWKDLAARAPGNDSGPEAWDLTFLGSEGVRLETGGKTLFLNAFYQPRLFHTSFPALLPEDVDKADALLYTSAHRDIFDPWQTLKVVEKTGAVVVGPPAVIRLMKERGVAEEKLVELQPKTGFPVSYQNGEMKAEAYAVAHSGDFIKDGAPDHVAYVVTVGERKVVHFGNASEPKGMGEDAAKDADLVFLPAWMVVLKNEEFLKSIGARYLIPVHAPDTPDAYGPMENLRTNFPRVVPLLPGHRGRF